MSDKVDIANQVTMYLGGSSPVFSLIWASLDKNHTQIAAICAIIGIFIGVIGLFYNIRHKRRIERSYKPK